MKKNRPNYGINVASYPYAILGDNNLRRVFENCFNIMLSSCYNDNTKSARYYNKISDDNTSAYYVQQKEIESVLDNVYNVAIDQDKFLIGFTGIGKTTLLKNYFKIVNANPFVDDKKSLIAYISVYSDDINTNKDIDKVFEGFLRSIVEYLNDYEDFNLTDAHNAIEFFNFIKNYKSRLLKSEDLFINAEQSPIKVLKLLHRKEPVQFYSLLIKYLVELINNKENKINQIFFIFDDIESQRKDVHIPFIAKAQNIVACIRTIDNRNFIVKSIISLRNYTFRYHHSRQTKAKRIPSDDVILKSTIPSMQSIFAKRFEVYYDNPDVSKTISDEKSWNLAKETLESVVSDIADFGEMISSIAHYDISHSFRLFLQVLTNHRWFAPNESYYQGAFGIPKSSEYLSQKERVFKALMYGENKIYVDNEESLVPNFLAIHEEENPGIELFSLYVLEYMLTLQRHNGISLYGRNSIKGDKIRDNLKTILCLDAEKTLKLEFVIKRLYEQEYLLHSVYEPEYDKKREEYELDRQYNGKYGLYLSIRGNQVLEMLSRDSLLFEVFRDDIDTDLSNNTIPSSELNQTLKLSYLISYCSQLFEIEKEFISHSNKEQYFRNFYNCFIISRLLKGIQNTFRYFYKNEDDDAMVIRNELTNLYKKIIAYKNVLEKSEELDIDISFITEFLSTK